MAETSSSRCCAEGDRIGAMPHDADVHKDTCHKVLTRDEALLNSDRPDDHVKWPRTPCNSTPECRRGHCRQDGYNTV